MICDKMISQFNKIIDLHNVLIVTSTQCPAVVACSMVILTVLPLTRILCYHHNATVPAHASYSCSHCSVAIIADKYCLLIGRVSVSQLYIGNAC